MNANNLVLERKVLDIDQIRGMCLSMQRGEQLAREHPEIADAWIDGKTEKKLGKKYFPGDSVDVARNAVHYALKELMNRRERRRIARVHNIDGSRKGGRSTGARMISEGFGIYAPQNAEKLRMARIKGGKIGGAIAGRRNYDAGIGIASLSTEQLRAIGKRAHTREEWIEIGRKSAIARGEALYDGIKKKTELGIMNERKYTMEMKERFDYAWEDIALNVNEIFENNRGPGTLCTMYSKWKKEKSKGEGRK